MSTSTVLTGITPSGTPHIGNYIGAIKPAIEAQHADTQNLYFIADLHSLVKLWDAEARQKAFYEVAATWLALGLDPDKTIFYRQSDISEISELNWILSSLTAKGLLNRAHAYKDQVSANLQEKQDPDQGVTLGLYTYPILMAADILAFNANRVPVGKDQIQHIEIARDIAARFNHVYKSEVLTLPVAQVGEKTQIIPGLDGRKMSKSYQNTIPLFEPAKKLRKCVMKIKTNSQPPEEPKDPTNCSVFKLYQAIATEAEAAELEAHYKSGIGWGDAKQILFEQLDGLLEEPRARYQAIISDPAEIDRVLVLCAEKAKSLASETLSRVKQACGL